MLLVVNHCKNHNVVNNFDFSRGCQNNILETKKNMRVLHCFFKQFLLVHNCASVYSLALYQQVFLVIMFISWMFITSSFKKSLIVEQFQGNITLIGLLWHITDGQKYNIQILTGPEQPGNCRGTVSTNSKFLARFSPCAHTAARYKLTRVWELYTHLKCDGFPRQSFHEDLHGSAWKLPVE